MLKTKTLHIIPKAQNMQEENLNISFSKHFAYTANYKCMQFLQPENSLIMRAEHKISHWYRLALKYYHIREDFENTLDQFCGKYITLLFVSALTMYHVTPFHNIREPDHSSRVLN